MKKLLLGFSFSLFLLNAFSQIANQPSDLSLCDADNDGFEQFDLTILEAEIIGNQTNVSVSFYETLVDAEDGVNAIPSLYTNISNPQTIFARVEGSTGNYDTTSFDLIVNPTPAVVEPSPLELCDDNGDEITVFDLTVKDSEITGGNVTWAVTYYEALDDAVAQFNAIQNPTQYTNTFNPQTIYAVVTDTNTGCYSITTFDLIVNPTPFVNQPTPLELCDDGVPDGSTSVDLSIKNTEISGNNPNYSVSYYLTQANAEAAVDQLPIPYTNTFNPQTIFVRVENNITGCYNTTSFDLVVEQAPAAITPTPLYYCDTNNDGFGEFDLASKDNEITGGVPGLTVTYYETLANAYNNVDAIDTSNLYSNVAPSTQTLHARVEANSSNCITFVELDLVVNTGVQANPDLQPIVYQQCDDNAETDGDPSDDSLQFDLSVLDFQILDGQSSSLYTLSYFATLMDAEAGVNPLPTLYQNITNPQIIYARVENSTGCYDIAEATLMVTPIPYLSIEDTILCVDESVTIDTGLSSDDYAFLWYVDGFVISGETLPALTIDSPGLYTVQVIDLQGCGSVTTEFLVTELPCPDADSDGVDDSEEDINNNGNLDDDDTDDDGIPNYLDDDDDGDGVPTEDEIAVLSGRNSSSTHPFVDTDNDMIENYLDDDDDGDGVLTIDEDYNNNGDPTDDDTNSNMIPDYLEAAVALNVESLDKLSFKLYPNPAKDMVTVTLSQNILNTTEVSLVDIQGKAINIPRKEFNGTVELDVSSLNAGLYFIQLRSGNNIIIEKLIVE